MHKIPQVTLTFWIMKICATTLGETLGDLVSMTLNLGYALSSLVLIGLFVITLALQLVTKTYHVWLFWLVILSTSTAGTTVSDYMDRTLGLGYAEGSAILVSTLAAVLLLWWKVEGSINIKKIDTRSGESFYWAAILCSNTLGTALGDFLADSSGLGFVGGAALISGLIAVTVILYYCTSITRSGLFWIAFVLTRPLGATVGDLLTKSTEKGGLDVGTMGASAILGGMLLALILWTSLRPAGAETRRISKPR